MDVKVNRRTFLSTGARGALLLAAGPALLSACGDGGTGEDGPIEIGGISDLTGALAPLGLSQRNMVELAVADINDRGGVLGRDLTVRYVDGASDPATWASRVRDLSGIPLIIGGLTSAERDAIREAATADSLYIWPQLTEGEGECFERMFSTGPVPEQQVIPFIDHLMDELGASTFYFLGRDYNFPRAVNAIAMEHVRSRGGEALGEDYFALDATDFASAVSAISSAAPDAVFSNVIPPGAFSLIRQLNEAALWQDLTFATPGSDEGWLFGVEPDQIEGLYSCLDFYQDLEDSTTQEIIAAYDEEFGSDTPISAAGGATGAYRGIQLWAAAVEAAGSLDLADVEEAYGQRLDGSCAGRAGGDGPRHPALQGADPHRRVHPRGHRHRAEYHPGPRSDTVPLNSDEMLRAPFTTLRAMLDERRLRTTDLVGEHLRRIESYQGLAAFSAVDGDRAFADARARDLELDRGQRRSLMHGLPVSVKESIATAGLRVRSGSQAFQDTIAAEDAAVVTRMREGGAIVLGTNPMHEIGIGDPVRIGPLATGLHPRNPDFLPGGSSSGPAVAVSAGLTHVAIGADTGGSIRNPAASCGVFGLKPTYAAVPTGGSLPLCWSMDTLGPLARDVASLRAALSVLAPQLQGSAHHGPWTIGFLPDSSLEPIEDATAAVLQQVRTAVVAAGSAAVDVGPIDLSVAGPAWQARLAETAAVHAVRQTGPPPGYSPTVLEILQQGAEVTREDYAASWDVQRHLTEAVDRALQDCDVLALPVNPGPAALRWGEWHGLGVFNWYRYCWPFNLTGHPAVAVPVGADAHQVPIGLQLVGHQGTDLGLLACAEWVAAQVHFDTLAPTAAHW